MNRFLTKLNLGLSIIFSLFFTSIIAIANDENKLNVAYTDWFPYTYFENGRVQGFEIEIFKAVIKDMGLKADFTLYPWKRCLINLESGKSDIVISLLKTKDREKYTWYPDEHVSISRTVFFTSANNNINYSGSLADLKNLTVGLILGFSYGDDFDNADYLKKETALNPQILIKKLLAGRNDIAAENQTVIEGYAMKMGVRNQIRFLTPPIHSQKLYVGFSKTNNLKLCEDFSRSLVAFKMSDSYREILEAYGVSSSQLIMQVE